MRCSEAYEINKIALNEESAFSAFAEHHHLNCNHGAIITYSSHLLISSRAGYFIAVSVQCARFYRSFDRDVEWR